MEDTLWHCFSEYDEQKVIIKAHISFYNSSLNKIIALKKTYLAVASTYHNPAPKFYKHFVKFL